MDTQKHAQVMAGAHTVDNTVPVHTNSRSPVGRRRCSRHLPLEEITAFILQKESKTWKTNKTINM